MDSMQHQNYRPGGMPPTPNMHSSSQMPNQFQGHQGYHGYSGQPDVQQNAGYGSSNHPQGSMPSNQGSDNGSFYPPTNFQNYPNFRMPPPNFPPPNFQPPPRYPPPGPPSFPPNDQRDAYPPPHFKGTQNAPPEYPPVPFNNSGNPSSSFGQRNQYPDSSQLSQIMQDTDAKLQQLREKDSTIPTQEQTSKDDTWLKNWLQKNGALYRLKTPQPSLSISIPDASSKLRKALHLVERLQDERESIAQDSDAAAADQGNIEAMLAELSEIKQTLSGSTLDELVKKLDRAGKKRRRRRKQLREKAKRKEEREEKIASLHKAIDEKMAAAAQEILDKKKAMQVKAAADSTLAEVRRKILEATKAVDLMNGLTKLRSLRKESAQRKGLFVPPGTDESFQARTAEMEKILKQQLSVYESEKKALEVMLEQEQEEDKEKEKEIKRVKELREIKRQQKATESWLFSPKVTLHPEDPLHKYRQYYEVGDRNIDSLVKIRQEWDAYLVPMNAMEGSAIPYGWVQPVAPSSADWEAALVKSETNSSIIR